MGGPQAGIAVGRRDLISRMRRNPLMRALRPGKLTLAALAATVDAYLEDRAPSDVPVPAMLATEQQTLRQRASALAEAVNAKAGSAATAEPVPLEARAGGGAAPERTIPSYGISLGVPEGAAVAAARLRLGDPPVVALIRDEALIFDLRTVSPGEDGVLAQAIIKAVMTQ
jgi:L-seryl-tRNA(Ser) seleniumtransferase